MSRSLNIFLLACLSLLLGCQPERPAPPPAKKAKPAAAKLSLLVVEDAELAAGIKLLRGEWAERSGGELEVSMWTKTELLAATELPADLVIYPSRYVGTLVDRDWLRPVRKSVLESDQVDTASLYPLIRNVVMPLGQEVYALSLGDAPLLLGLESDLGQREKFRWDEISNPEKSTALQLDYPLATTFLMRGIAYSQQSDGSAALFDPVTMHPRIAEPQYVKVLREMVGSVAPSTWMQVGGIPGWPHANSKDSLAWHPFPVAAQVYNPVLDSWEANDTGKPITFLGFAGRSVSVARSTRNSSSAFKLMSWLVSADVATQLSPRSSATLWVRKDQAAQAARWLPEDGSADEVPGLVGKLLSADSYFLLPRIPQIDDYLESLEQAVERAIVEVNPADTVLPSVVDQWNRITDQVGRDRQRAAYRRHLRLEELAD